MCRCRAATADVAVLDSHGVVLPSEVLRKDAETNTFHLLVEARDVPSLGYEVLHVVPGKQAVRERSEGDGTTLENAALRVVVDPQTGCITSLYDKKTKFETLAAGACGNELQAFKDTPKDYDAWNIDPGTLDQPPARLTEADSVRAGGAWADAGVDSRDAALAEFEVRAGHRARCRVATRSVVVNDIDWHETHVLLKAAFPLVGDEPSLRRTKFLMAPSSGRRRATTAGRRRSSKCPRCAGPIWGMRQARVQPDQRIEVRIRRRGQCAAPVAAALADVARSRTPTADIITSATRCIRTPATGSRR